MGKKQTADGRWIIGGGENSTDYKGFLHWRECYICLTESGATEESVDYLNALKDYALAHYALGEPIMPPSMTVWVVANGKTTAVQANDVKVEDGDYTICGITYSDGAWDYSNAGQGGGGSGGMEVVFDSQTHLADKTWQEIFDAISAGVSVYMTKTNIEAGYSARFPILSASHNQYGYCISTASDIMDEEGIIAMSQTADGYPSNNPGS